MGVELWAWSRQGISIMLPHHQRTCMVNWSDEDHFAHDNIMIHCRYIFLKHLSTSDIVRHSWRKCGGTEIFFPNKTDQSYLRNSMLKDLLETIYASEVNDDCLALYDSLIIILTCFNTKMYSYRSIKIKRPATLLKRDSGVFLWILQNS